MLRNRLSFKQFEPQRGIRLILGGWSNSLTLQTLTTDCNYKPPTTNPDYKLQTITTNLVLRAKGLAAEEQ